VKRAYIFKLLARGDRALADLDQALKLDPDNQEAWLVRGSLYFSEKQLDRAIEDLHQAIRLLPDDPTPYQLLAEALMHKGNSVEALDKLGQALKKESSSYLLTLPWATYTWGIHR
jgi:tetratricopeptide (TPR) repeat protein